jgi:hypothetical protein
MGGKFMHVPPRILIVHDNESNRDILVTRLATHGYDLCQAADGDRYSITSSALRRIDCGKLGPGARQNAPRFDGPVRIKWELSPEEPVQSVHLGFRH